MSDSAPPAVRFEGISKRFPGVVALEDVSFQVAPGSCHAICGENGAGKSTLGKLLAGIHSADSGRLLLHGAPVHFASPADARRAGVGMVHQELAFAENLTVAENLCLGALPHRLGVVMWREVERRARALLQAIDAGALDVSRRVGELTVGEQQLVQIAAAVGSGARVLVLDEPTSSLSQREAEHLYGLVARLQAQGVTLLFVSHRMPEIYRLCDTITVLRDGRHVTTTPASALDEDSLVRAMIGRAVDEFHPRSLDKPPGANRLEVRGLHTPGRLVDVSFEVRAGEIVGLAGLVGAGRTDILRALFGLPRPERGQILVDGREVSPRDPTEAMSLGLGLVPEDRKRQGLVLGLPARENVSLPVLEAKQAGLSRGGFIRRGEEEALATQMFRRLRVRAPSTSFVVAGLSGGNQQKIVLAKWLAARCRVLLLDEPTRGVDVGAKGEIHELVDRLAAEGTAVLLVSSELPELLKLAHRILVLHEGRLTGELARKEFSEEVVMRLMGGVTGRAVQRPPPAGTNVNG